VIEIVSLVQRPALIPLVARWGFTEWPTAHGSLAAAEARAAACTATIGPDQCFVLIEDGVPAAMASLVVSDLDERPDLTPWLAGVYVDVPFRGRGHSPLVVARVEQAARDAGVATLWLYTRTAPGLYRKLGWRDSEQIVRERGVYQVMRRDFGLSDDGVV
jgi:GNAT superfamily N-acetyltransferase